jgi:4-hydroxy-2-oxoglutarate aldolase
MAKMSDISLGGVFSPLATPFNEQDEFAPEKMAFNISRLNQTSLSGYVVLGSNGEYVYLNEKEKIEVLKTARQAIPKDKLMIAGTGCESTRNTIHLTLKAAEIGADAAIIVNPSYYKNDMTVPVLADHYQKIADASPIPIIIYNFPPGTGIDLSAELLVQLSHHPNIIGVKDTGGVIPKMGETIRQAAPGFQVLAGSASFLFPSLVIGAVGGVLALANIAPKECVDIYRLFCAGDIENGRALHLRMLPVNAAITSRFGISGLKAAMDMLGYQGGIPRPPLLPLPETKKQELQNILKTGGLL